MSQERPTTPQAMEIDQPQTTQAEQGYSASMPPVGHSESGLIHWPSLTPVPGESRQSTPPPQSSPDDVHMVEPARNIFTDSTLTPDVSGLPGINRLANTPNSQESRQTPVPKLSIDYANDISRYRRGAADSESGNSNNSVEVTPSAVNAGPQLNSNSADSQSTKSSDSDGTSSNLADRNVQWTTDNSILDYGATISPKTSSSSQDQGGVSSSENDPLQNDKVIPNSRRRRRRITPTNSLSPPPAKRPKKSSWLNLTSGNIGHTSFTLPKLDELFTPGGAGGVKRKRRRKKNRSTKFNVARPLKRRRFYSSDDDKFWA